MAELKENLDGNTLTFTLSGEWVVAAPRPEFCEIVRANKGATKIVLIGSDITNWDSGLMTRLLAIGDYAADNNIELCVQKMPDGCKRLLNLATTVPEKKDAARKEERFGFVHWVGITTLFFFRELKELAAFLGEVILAALAVFKGRSVLRRQDISIAVEGAGYRALPIIGLISFLVGLIMAFVGAVQLSQFGADIYVADLVGLALVREMGAMMAAVIMAGRTGAAYAAEIGSMRVGEEIDALRTFGFSPYSMLVMPRMIALILMMPLLCTFANFIGMAGGLVVAVGMLDVTVTQYVNQTMQAVSLVDYSTGIIKSSIFGILVAAAGCLRGMQCGSSSEAVGHAATSAVVTAITWIIVADAVFAVLFNILGI